MSGFERPPTVTVSGQSGTEIEGDRIFRGRVRYCYVFIFGLVSSPTRRTSVAEGAVSLPKGLCDVAVTLINTLMTTARSSGVIALANTGVSH